MTMKSDIKPGDLCHVKWDEIDKICAIKRTYLVVMPNGLEKFMYVTPEEMKDIQKKANCKCTLCGKRK